MVKSTETSSTKSSTTSSKVASFKKTVQKGATTLAWPFKKLKKSVFIALTCSIRSRSSTTLPLCDIGALDNGNKSSADSGGIHSHGSDSDSNPEVELSPEQELGMQFVLLHLIPN